MSRWLRAVLAWVLAVALPFQGVAAATMFACGPGHDAQANHGGSHAVHDHSHHARSIPAAGAHDADDVEATEHASEHRTQGVSGKVSASKCSACAACCVGAALPAATVTFDLPAVTDFFAPSAAHAVAPFLTSGLERPPRSSLA